MVRYRLIKSYPRCSYELGDIIDGVGCKETYLEAGSYPEFWEVVTTPIYKLLIEYPGSPRLHTLLTRCITRTNGKTFYNYTDSYGETRLIEEKYLNNTTFWQKI